MDTSLIPIFFLEIIKADVKAKVINLIRQDDEIATLTVPNSTYYLVLNKNSVQDGKDTYNLWRYPAAEGMVTVRQVVCFPDQAMSEYKHWIGLVKKHSEIKKELEFDDPILQAYYDEIEMDFEIIDEDADKNPFKFKQQEEIVNIYENIIKLILQEKEEDNEIEATAILKEIEVAKKQLPKSTKKGAINTLKKVIALCKKYSYNVAKAISAEVLVEIGKTLLIG